MKQCKYIGKDLSLAEPLKNCYYEIEKSVPIEYAHIIYVNNSPTYYLNKEQFDKNFIDITKLRKQKIITIRKNI